MRAVDAVIFDLDGVIVESEGIWDAARRDLVARTGGTWRDDATRAMMGMSSPEWARYLRDELGVPLPVEEIGPAVVAEIACRYRERLPLIPGAVEAVRALADHWPLGLASSSNRPIIDLVLAEAGIADRFAATVSSEEVARGKPSPDVYLEAARRLGADPARCVAIEDSTNGIRAAAAAGMTVVAVPNAELPPAEDALALAAAVVDSPGALTPELVRGLG
ncbi:MAG: HAD family phosphatase [Solirubrobacteraceae bacterium]|nr:HAD family phosphatase [Solirubrobacteraceae bacterium]